MTHNTIMRTTVTISDHLLIEAKKLAATRRTSLAFILEDSLRFYLAELKARKPEQADWSLPVSDAGPPRAGVDLNDTSELLEL